MDITIQRLPDGRLQAYGEDLEAAREVITQRDGEEPFMDKFEFVTDLLSAIDRCVPVEQHWEPAEPDPDVAYISGILTD